MNKYLDVIKAFTEIVFYLAISVLQNLEKQVSKQKQTKSTHTPYSAGALGRPS